MSNQSWSDRGIKEECMADSDDSDVDWRGPGDKREPHRRHNSYGFREDEVMSSMLRRILPPSRHSSIEKLVASLQAEGVIESGMLERFSKDFLERRFGASLTAGEVSDLIKVWETLQASKAQSGRTTHHPKGSSKGHSSKYSKGVASYRQGSRKRSGLEQTGARSRSRSPRGVRSVSQYEVSACSLKAPPLFSAVRKDDSEGVRRILEGGASVHDRYQGWTPLMVAAEINSFSTCLLLLEKEADVAAINRKGRCALSFAAAPSRDETTQKERKSAIRALKLLLSWKADPDRVDRRGSLQHKVVSSREFLDCFSRCLASLFKTTITILC